ncbi:uncharacterized protein LOC135804951 [Sycon ciliatum]|uniref:uncharacterized protein LOC135804951 n=1 Tax=Sycon ciliatum TaxID=27933 RepID=UPI0020AB93D9|eukprot:scpid47619/ scgid25122/ Uncharacterized protein YER152C
MLAFAGLGRAATRAAPRTNRLPSQIVHRIAQRSCVDMSDTLFEDIGILVSGANLGIGSPGPKELATCNQLFAEATQFRISKEDSTSLFSYGPRSGHPGFRAQLASFLSKHYGDAVDPDDLMPTGGASQGLTLLTNYYFSSGDVVFVEDASYFLALTFFKNDCNMKIISVPTDDGGIIPAEFESLVTQHSKDFRAVTDNKPFKAMLYTISTYQNPTGRSLDAQRCNDILRVAKANDLLVLSEDVYNLLPFSQSFRDGDFNSSYVPATEEKVDPSPLRMYHYDRLANSGNPGYGNVVSNCTFSKILAPGSRLGWMEGSKHVLDPVRRSSFVQSGGAIQHFMAGIGEALLELGLQEKQLAHCRQAFENRAKALCRGFRAHLPSEVVWKPPHGGYFMWLRLPDNVSGMDVRKAALKENISLTHGEAFSLEGKFKNYIRVCYTYEEEDTLEKAGETIGRIIKDLM